MTPTRWGDDPDLDDVLLEAIRQDHDVGLDVVDGALVVTVDGEPWTQIARESFGFPIDRITLDDPNHRDLAEQLHRDRRRRQLRSRMDRLSTESHTAAHGESLPTEESR